MTMTLEENELKQLNEQVVNLEDSFTILITHISKASYYLGYVEGKMTVITNNLSHALERACPFREKDHIERMHQTIKDIQTQLTDVVTGNPFLASAKAEPSQTTSETLSFRKIAEDFQNGLNQALEDCPYDDSIMENLNDIFELLDVTVEHL